MTEPHNAVYDNNQFISNITDWLATSERAFHLSDFPYFLKDASLVTYADVSLLCTGIELNNLLVDLGKSPRVVKYEEAAVSLPQDTVFIGLFKDAAKVRTFLERGNIISTDTNIELPGIRTIPQAGTSIIYLYKEGDTRLLVILADTQKRLQETQDLLKSGEFRRWLVSDILAIYQPADFSLSSSPISFTSGGSATFNVSIIPSGGFVDTVRLTSASTPAGLTVTPASTDVTSPYPTTTFTVASSTPGTYMVTITGTSGTLTRTTAVAVTVNAR